MIDRGIYSRRCRIMPSGVKARSRGFSRRFSRHLPSRRIQPGDRATGFSLRMTLDPNELLQMIDWEPHVRTCRCRYTCTSSSFCGEGFAGMAHGPLCGAAWATYQVRLLVLSCQTQTQFLVPPYNLSIFELTNAGGGWTRPGYG